MPRLDRAAISIPGLTSARWISMSWCAFAVALAMAHTGCVRRRLTIRSDPPGALTYVDDQEIGITPCSTPFTYYGTRKVQLIRDGHETVTQLHTIKRPWYQYPLVEFFAENVYPGELRDERELNFALAPQQITNVPRLVDRAEEMRRNTQQGVVAPLPGPTPLPDIPTETPAGPSGVSVPFQPGNPPQADRSPLPQRLPPATVRR